MERANETYNTDYKPMLGPAIQRDVPAGEVLEYVMVDAFTGKAYEGNPAAVVVLPKERGEDWMQNIAAEFNVSQTAFVKKMPDSLANGNSGDNGHLKGSSSEHFGIRWFTPTCEVPLCGHATLASSYVLFKSGLVGGDKIVFHCKSGELTARKIEDVSAVEKVPLTEAGGGPDIKVELNFPMTDMTACDKSEIKCLSKSFKDVTVNSVWRSGHNDLVVELSSAEEVQKLEPLTDEMVQCSGRGCHVTAKAGDRFGVDFASRCFFPKIKIYEDPVCGSAHCAFTPFWAKKLGKDSLEAYQGGDVVKLTSRT